MKRVLEFKWMDKDRVMSHVWVDKDGKDFIVESIDYDDRPIFNFFGKRPKTIESIHNKLRQRCFEETRPDRDELLALMGLTQYSPLDICLKTDGRMISDPFWIDWIVRPF